MLNNNYTCFIISPIGNRLGDDKEKERYQRFKSVFDYLILPALRLAGFQEGNIIRSDYEAKTGRISESIVTHLKQDDLCIADLTGLNPNVMYEYGVRTGVGKPVIPIASSETVLPFDVVDVRTILYRIDDINNIMEAQRTLEKYIQSEINEGFSPQNGRGSYIELSERLERIEKDLAQLITRDGSPNPAPLNGKAEKIIRELGSARAAFNYALRNRDIVLGEALLPRLKMELPKDSYIDKVISQLAAMGSQKAGIELRESWEYIKNNLTLRQQYEEIGCYISFCNRNNTEVEELEFISTELTDLERRVNASDLPDDEKRNLQSGIYNQNNRLYFGAYQTASNNSQKEVDESWLRKAIDYLEKAVLINPKEASYYYNLAICYRESKQLDQAVEAIDQCMKLDTKDSDHLRLAYMIYKEAGKDKDAEQVKAELEIINPYVAAML